MDLSIFSQFPYLESLLVVEKWPKKLQSTLHSPSSQDEVVKPQLAFLGIGSLTTR